MLLLPQSIPSPGWSAFHLGPLTIHAYALCILAGIVAGWSLAVRRFTARGGDRDHFEEIIGASVLAGIVGARLYHVITDHQLYFGAGRRPMEALYIWNGGLGIWGGVALGGITAWLLCRRKGVDFSVLADAGAPGLILAQAIGRLGNWFNQELFGRPTTRPWGLEIDAVHRPDGFEQFATFHPTFAYEMLWNLAGVAFLLWAERRFRLAHGRVFALYVAYYCAGRLWIEHLRIDPVNTAAGFRLNEYTSVIVLLCAVIVFMLLSRRHENDEASGLPQA
ncbi:Prolipoprotein diacylglyceryl transferase [Luteococcus japonicus LSP_Lj1]|uniref:Phosphatidylglycerol--prolipoprotein diacylglyceryl transferase n=1 Tax=Luteococcus japonicus LSP_Lj1 TaxID=1255658 RepID=A0A1R4JLB4_9ACTN|nr:Prolipoprotein diacylglyceryl transferase [Luteococcus japonicus LSP_Lj1]